MTRRQRIAALLALGLMLALAVLLCGCAMAGEHRWCHESHCELCETLALIRRSCGRLPLPALTLAALALARARAGAPRVPSDAADTLVARKVQLND